QELISYLNQLWLTPAGAHALAHASAIVFPLEFPAHTAPCRKPHPVPQCKQARSSPSQTPPPLHWYEHELGRSCGRSAVQRRRASPHQLAGPANAEPRARSVIFRKALPDQRPCAEPSAGCCYIPRTSLSNWLSHHTRTCAARHCFLPVLKM